MRRPYGRRSHRDTLRKSLRRSKQTERRRARLDVRVDVTVAKVTGQWRIGAHLQRCAEQIPKGGLISVLSDISASAHVRWSRIREIDVY